MMKSAWDKQTWRHLGEAPRGREVPTRQLQPHLTALQSRSGCAFLLSEDARNFCGLNQGATGGWPSKLPCSHCSVPFVSLFPSPVYLAHSIKSHLLQEPPSAVRLQTSGQEPQELWGGGWGGDTH